MADATGYGEPGRDDEEPFPDLRPFSDAGPMDGIEIIELPPAGQEGDDWSWRGWRRSGDGQGDDSDIPRRPRPGRPVVGSTLTSIGLAGTVAAAALPWSGGLNLPASRSHVEGQSWLVWLLLAVLAAGVFGVLSLARPGRGVRWAGAVAAAAGAVLSGYAIVGLPPDQTVGVGPGLAGVTLAVLAAGQLVTALTRSPRPPWRWRPAVIIAAVVAAVFAAAGLGSAGIATATDVDATTPRGPLVPVTGPAPSVVDHELWRADARVDDVAGSNALVIGESERGPIDLVGIGILDLRTGMQRWHHYERGWAVRETALTQDGSTAMVVVDTGDETDAIGFDVASGRMIWRQRLGTSINCVGPEQDQISPAGSCAGQLVTGDGLLYVGATAANGTIPITYLNAHTGKVWPVRLGPGCRLRGAGGDRTGLYLLDQCVTAGFPDPHLISETAIAYSLDGRKRWSTPLNLVQGTVAGSYGPVFVRADVVLVQQEQRYVALTIGNGTQLWTSTSPFEPENTVTDGSLLAWSTGVQVVMLDLHTGATLWQQQWTFPQEADMPVLISGRLYLIQHTVGPNPYTCAEQATLLTLDPATGHGIAHGQLPDGAGNDCGPDVEDHSYLRGPLLILVTASTITVLAGH